MAAETLEMSMYSRLGAQVVQLIIAIRQRFPFSAARKLLGAAVARSWPENDGRPISQKAAHGALPSGVEIVVKGAHPV